MTSSLLITAGAILLLLLISAFFSGSETALTAVSKARMAALEKEGNNKARIVNRLIEDQEKLIGAILLGNNMVNILASSLTTTLFLGLFGSSGVVYATIVMTAMVVIFAEVLPKTYAIKNSEKAALAVSSLLSPIIALFAPMARIVVGIAMGLLKFFGGGGEAKGPSALEEIRDSISLHHMEGAMIKDDRDMLSAILDLKDMDVSDIMVHRTDMESLNADDNPKFVVDGVLKSAYTRVPLWRDEPENIVGVLHTKDLLRDLLKHNGNYDKLDIPGLATEAWYVPETTPLKEQLKAFLKKKRHFALVVDEYGEVMGLVTLEDIIEEIVGEISDEHDIEFDGIRPQPDGSVNIDGHVSIRDINRHLGWSLPDEDATTLAGLVIHETQNIPEPGQQFTFHNFRFEILRKQKNRITAVKLRKMPQEGA